MVNEKQTQINFPLEVTPTTQEIFGLLAELRKKLEDKGIKEVKVSIQFENDTDRCMIQLMGSNIDPLSVIPDMKFIWGSIFWSDAKCVWTEALNYVRTLKTQEERDRERFIKLAADLVEFGKSSGYIPEVYLLNIQQTIQKLSSNIIEDKSSVSPSYREGDF